MKSGANSVPIHFERTVCSDTRRPEDNDCACAPSISELTNKYATWTPSHTDSALRHPNLGESARLHFGRIRNQNVLFAEIDEDDEVSRELLKALSPVTLAQVEDIDTPEMASEQGGVPPKTLHVWMHVTNECNLRCNYCYINKTEDQMSLDTAHTAVDTIFRTARQHGFATVRLKFAGGEAMLNLRRVFEIHEYAQIRSQSEGIGLAAVILTNGVFISDRIIQQLKSRDIRVAISLDGVGEVHDRQRTFANGSGSFKWVDRTINRLIQAEHLPFISVTVTGQNAEHLSELVKYLRRKNLPFNINFYRENDCSAHISELRFQEEAIIRGMHAAFDVLEHDLPRFSLLGFLVDRAQFDMPHSKTCSVGEAYMVIDHNGNIAKCQMEIDTPITTVFAEDPLLELKSSPVGVQNLPVEEKEGCRECEWQHWCAGGCPIVTFRATGRYDVKSPNCNIYKQIFPRLLRLEALRLLRLAEEAGQLPQSSLFACRAA